MVLRSERQLWKTGRRRACALPAGRCGMPARLWFKSARSSGFVMSSMMRIAGRLQARQIVVLWTLSGPPRVGRSHVRKVFGSAGVFAGNAHHELCWRRSVGAARDNSIENKVAVFQRGWKTFDEKKGAGKFSRTDYARWDLAVRRRLLGGMAGSLGIAVRHVGHSMENNGYGQYLLELVNRSHSQSSSLGPEK